MKVNVIMQKETSLEFEVYESGKRKWKTRCLQLKKRSGSWYSRGGNYIL